MLMLPFRPGACAGKTFRLQPCAGGGSGLPASRNPVFNCYFSPFIPLGTRAAAVGCFIGRLYPKILLEPAYFAAKKNYALSRALAEILFKSASCF